MRLSRAVRIVLARHQAAALRERCVGVARQRFSTGFTNQPPTCARLAASIRYEAMLPSFQQNEIRALNICSHRSLDSPDSLDNLDNLRSPLG
jgi:hypothetical protein